MRCLVRRSLVLAACAASGCQTVGTLPDLARAVRPGFHDGTAVRVFSVSVAEVDQVAAPALNDLKVSNLRRDREKDGVRLQGRTADGRWAHLTIHERPGAGSVVTAHVGRFGDEAFSQAVMDRLAIRLGLQPVEPIPTDPPSTPASNPFFSSDAVPDSVMLREQADLGYRDSVVP